MGRKRCDARPSDVSELFLPTAWRVGKLFTPLIRIRELPCMNTSGGQIILTRLFVPFASHSRPMTVKLFVKSMKLSCEIPLTILDFSSTQKNPLDAHCHSAYQEMSSPFREPYVSLSCSHLLDTGPNQYEISNGGAGSSYDSSLKLCIFVFIQGRFPNCVPRVVFHRRKKRVKCWGDNSELHRNSALYSAERSYSVLRHYF